MKKHFTLLLLVLMLALASSARAEANEFLIKARLWYLTNIQPAENRMSVSLAEAHLISKGLNDNTCFGCNANPDDVDPHNQITPYWITTLSEETIDANSQSLLISDNFYQYLGDNYQAFGHHEPGIFDGLARTGVNLLGSMINSSR
jgi:hypothetical protein